jgi:asparagine synthase (glutamine-hydrolysing)
LLLAAWEKWGEECLDRILGDYAFALWDADHAALMLVRAPMAMKSLVSRSSGSMVAFASTPSAFWALPQLVKSPDLQFASASIAGVHPVDGSTIYEGIRQVRHGHAIKFKSGREQDRRFWTIAGRVERRSDPADYGLGLRAELERAVSAQSRGLGRLGAHLSSGRDSNAVCATAAKINPGELMAFTGVPRAGFEADDDRRIVEESGLAAKTAAMHSNIRHIVCPRAEQSLFALLGEAQLLQQEPMPNVTNLPWWWAVNARASEHGVQVMLGGTAGNFTISPLGERHLVDVFRERGAGAWWHSAREVRCNDYVGWPFLLRSTFGPWVPRWFDASVMRATGRGHVVRSGASLLNKRFRREVEVRFSKDFAETRPPRSQVEFRRRMLHDWVFSDRFSQQRFGVDFRDPTSDRRLIDYCFSLPVEALTAAGSSRPVYDAAFQDRLPRAILSLGRRGYQGADWHEMTSATELLGLIDHYWQSPAVAELLDRSAIRLLSAQWPAKAGLGEDPASPFRDRLMTAMGMANFLAVTFDGLPAVPNGRQ